MRSARSPTLSVVRVIVSAMKASNSVERRTRSTKSGHETLSNSDEPRTVPTGSATFVVTKTADTNDGTCDADCSLREAIVAANANGAGADTITLPAGTYTLTIPGTGEDAGATGDLDIVGDLTINGAGAATTIVDGGGLDRVFHVVSSFTVVFNDLTITNGATVGGDNGGGLLNEGGNVTLTNCVICGNTTPSGGNGAGLYNDDTMTVTSCAVSGNSTAGGGNGGGIYDNGLSITMTNTTVSGNSVPGGDGGGLYANGISQTVSQSTVQRQYRQRRRRRRDLQQRDRSRDHQLHHQREQRVRRRRSFPERQRQPHHDDDREQHRDEHGWRHRKPRIDADRRHDRREQHRRQLQRTVSDGGTNLQFPGTTCSLSITSADPLLGPLANNGGPTQTMAIPAGSPAVDANTEICPPTPATDQRGVARPQGPACDIGAFELQADRRRLRR